jgi:hypothetical protein
MGSQWTLGRLHDYEIIVLQDERLDHPPVTTYFTRYGTNILVSIN